MQAAAPACAAFQPRSARNVSNPSYNASSALSPSVSRYPAINHAAGRLGQGWRREGSSAAAARAGRCVSQSRVFSRDTASLHIMLLRSTSPWRSTITSWPAARFCRGSGGNSPNSSNTVSTTGCFMASQPGTAHRKLSGAQASRCLVLARALEPKRKKNETFQRQKWDTGHYAAQGCHLPRWSPRLPFQGFELVHT